MLTKKFLALFFTAMLMFSGAALAQPPNGDDEDPTCETPGAEQSQDCAGDNGDPGCQGVNKAREVVAGTPGEDALEFVVNILDDGPKSDEDCDTTGNSGRQP